MEPGEDRASRGPRKQAIATIRNQVRVPLRFGDG
jgi:hypothetical protein